MNILIISSQYPPINKANLYTENMELHYMARQWAKMGHKVFTATTTNGNVGSATLPMDEIAAIRKEEARKAQAELADIISLFKREGIVYNGVHDVWLTKKI